jgi:hypothetical protein
MLVMVLVSGVISIGLIWAVAALARSQYWGKAGVCVFCGVATVPFLFCFFPAVAVQSLLTVVLTLVCGAFRSKSRTVTWAAVVVICRKWTNFRMRRPARLTNSSGGR